MDADTTRLASGRGLPVLLGLLLVAALVPGIAWGMPANPTLDLEPEVAGLAAVRAGQRVIVSGNAQTGTITGARLVAVEVDGDEIASELSEFSLNSGPSRDTYVRNQDGRIDGRASLGCLFADPAVQQPGGCAPHDVVRDVYMEVDVNGVTYQSDSVRVDPLAPQIQKYEVTTPTTIRVTFTEPVSNPDGDAAADWDIEVAGVTVIDVTNPAGSDCYQPSEGSVPEPDTVPGPDARAGSEDCVRVLHLSMALGRDATPEVGYFPPPSRQKYEDGADNGMAIHSGTRARSLAIDKVGPAPPRIDRVAGETVSGDGTVHGRDSTPAVHVTDVSEGHQVQLLVNGQPDGGRVTAGSDGAELVASELESGQHVLTVVAFDTADCDPNDSLPETCENTSEPSNAPRYVLDTVAPAPVDAVVDPGETGNDTVVEVFLSEPVSGTNGASQWSLTGCVGGCPTVITVSGSDGTSTRRLQADGPVPLGAELSWTPPASDGYRDAAGNVMAAFTGLDIKAELPAFLEALPAGLVGEAAGSATFRVRLTKPQTLPAIVEWRTEDGSARAGDDYESSSGFVTFLPGQTEQQVEVPVDDDTLDEPNETFFLVLEQSQGAPVDDADRRATATIVDDDPEVGIVLGDDLRTPETDSITPLSVRVALEAPSGKQVRVTWRTAAGTATEGSDYRGGSGTLTFEPGATVRFVELDLLGDTHPERDETFQIDLSSPVNATLVRGTAVVTILNDEPSVSTFACPDGQVPPLEFDDVEGTHAANVACVAWYTIALGRGDLDDDGRPEYDPHASVTRAQMASFVARLAVEGGVDLPVSPPDAFEDDDESVHRLAIDQLAALGIVQGRADTEDSDGDGDTAEVLYFPDAPVTRAQMASYVARVHEAAAGRLPAGPNAFEDDDRSVHRDAIDAIAAAGIANGRRDIHDSDGDGDRNELLYFPHERVTRAQMASFLVRDLGILVKDDAAHVGGASTELTDDTAPPGGELAGLVRSYKQVRSLVVDGCGIVSQRVEPDANGYFSVRVPSDQPHGRCSLELTVTTTRAGTTTEQTVRHIALAIVG